MDGRAATVRPPAAAASRAAAFAAKRGSTGPRLVEQAARVGVAGEAEPVRRLVDEAAELVLHVRRQADRLLRQGPPHAFTRALQCVGAARGDPLLGPAAPADVLRRTVAAQPAAGVTRAEEAALAGDALDDRVHVEGVLVPHRRLQSVEGDAVDGVTDDEQLETGGSVAPGADAGHHARTREGAGERRQRLLIPGLDVHQRRRRVRSVAVAGEAVAPGEQRRAHRGERPLAGATEEPAVAGVGDREPRPVPASGPGRGGLRQHHAGEDLGILLGERARERRRRRGPGHRIGEHLHSHAQPGGRDDAVAHAGAEVKRTDRRVPHVEDDAARWDAAGPGREDRRRHLEEHRRLPCVILAGAADGLVGPGGDGEVRVQRMQVGRHVAGGDETVDAVGIPQLMHDPSGERLVAERGRPGPAGARVAERRSLAHVVDVDAPGCRAQGEVALRVSCRHEVLAAAALERGGNGGRQQQHPAHWAG